VGNTTIIVNCAYTFKHVSTMDIYLH